MVGQAARSLNATNWDAPEGSIHRLLCSAPFLPTGMPQKVVMGQEHSQPNTGADWDAPEGAGMRLKSPYHLEPTGMPQKATFGVGISQTTTQTNWDAPERCVVLFESLAHWSRLSKLRRATRALIWHAVLALGRRWWLSHLCVVISNTYVYYLFSRMNKSCSL